MRETRTDDGLLVEPADARAALVVVSGSSGRLEEERARVLARHGIATYAFHWYDGMPAPLSEVPLETFLAPVDRVRSLAPVVGILGTSFGAEAALLLAARGVPLDVVVALAPTSVVWQSPLHDEAGRPVGEDKWSWEGRPIAGVPYLDPTTWTGRPIETALEAHEESLRTCTGGLEQVGIEVERSGAELVVTSGGADQVWPSHHFCRQVVERRRRHGLSTVHVHHPGAGHRAVLPGETLPTPRPGTPRSGGTPAADRAHGADVLAAVLERIAAPPRHPAG